MIVKTEGIVLRTFRHQDHNLIASVYTVAAGRRSFIIPGYNSARSRRKYSLLQPLSIVELIYSERATRTIQKINECKTSVLLNELQTHPTKLSLGLAIVEICYDCLKSEESDPDLYQLLRDTLTGIDQAEDRLIHYFIFFLIHQTRYLGFFPNDQVENPDLPIHFDTIEGFIYNVKKELDPSARLLRDFMQADIETCRQLHFDRLHKRLLLKSIFEYYRHHIEGFQYPQTLRVFAELFQ